MINFSSQFEIMFFITMPLLVIALIIILKIQQNFFTNFNEEKNKIKSGMDTICKNISKLEKLWDEQNELVEKGEKRFQG